MLNVDAVGVRTLNFSDKRFDWRRGLEGIVRQNVQQYLRLALKAG